MCGAGSCFACHLHRMRKKGDVTSLFCYQDIAGNGFQKGSGCSMENESLDTSKEETQEVQQPAAPEESGKQEDWKSPVKSLVNDLLDIAESVIVSVFVVVLVFAFILRPVTVDGKTVGAIGVIGPKRMDYKKVLASLDYFATGLSEELDGHDRSNTET